jgi:hypothetical protein
MSLSQKINETLSIILKFLAIVFIIVAVFWAGISIYVNITENDNPTGILKPPEIADAGYIIIFKTTGQVIFTDSIVTVNEAAREIYTVSGYYENIKGKFRFNKSTLVLDELYFGDITVKRRN